MKLIARSISPVLVLVLLGLWLLLNQSVALADILMGAVLAVGLAWSSSTLRPLRASLRRADAAAKLLLVVIWDIVQSNLRVARLVLGGARLREIHSGFVQIPLDLRDPHGLAALAAIITSAPGTVWSGLSAHGDTVTLHVLDLADEAALINLVKHRYERPLMRIFE